MSRIASLLPASVALLMLNSTTATAQYYPPGHPCNPCVQMQPVIQNCYRTVPVTEYQQVKQVVQRPVVETKYVEQPVTEYRPVTEQRTAEVPYTTYDNVTEYQTVQRDAGCWQTYTQPNCKVSPCQYDPRPGFLGWMNRTSYSMRSAFTPNYTTHRQYVPNVIAETIPVTRQVARQQTRQVTYNVTRMEAYQTTRKVAVNEVRYVAEEVTVNRPVTVMRTVPIGTSVAYTYGPYGAPSATALNPVPDPLSRSATTTVPSKTASGTDSFGSPAEPFRRESSSFKPATLPEETIIRSRHIQDEPAKNAAKPAENSNDPQVGRAPSMGVPARTVPSIVRVSGQWTARQPQPAADEPAISVADSGR